MSDKLDPLVLDLVEWVAKQPRSYADVMTAWRTSCPRLTVWEDAVDRGFLMRKRQESGNEFVMITQRGRRFLAENKR